MIHVFDCYWHELKVMHLSLSGGGARGMVFASFFAELEKSPEGQKVLKSFTSMSGVSAGALVAAPLSCRIKPSHILRETENSGLTKTFYWVRALGMFLGLKKSMYSTDHLCMHLNNVIGSQVTQIPLCIAVTEEKTVTQKCLAFDKGSSSTSVVNCAAASAAVPAFFESRFVRPVGKCCDGGLNCSFPVNTLLREIRSGNNVVMFNSAPWPGYRIPTGSSRQQIVANWVDQLNTHALEWLKKELGPQFKYKDGIFRYKNVIFIAPTGSQYKASHGAKGAGEVFYKHQSKLANRFIEEGKQIAHTFLQMKRRCLI